LESIFQDNGSVPTDEFRSYLQGKIPDETLNIICDMISTHDGSGQSIMRKADVEDFITSEATIEDKNKPLLQDHGADGTKIEDRDVTYKMSSMGTQFVLRDLKTVGTSTMGFVLNTVKFITKLPAKAVGVDPKYTHGVMEDGKGMVLELGNVVGGTLKVVSKTFLNGYDIARGNHLFDTMQIRFTRREISDKFSNGITLDELIKSLREQNTTSRCVGPIRVVGYQKQMYTLDNRQLYCLQRAGIEYAVVRLVQLRDVEDEWQEKFTTTNGGTSVEIALTPDELKPSAWTVTRQTINCSTFFPDIR